MLHKEASLSQYYSQWFIWISCPNSNFMDLQIRIMWTTMYFVEFFLPLNCFTLVTLLELNKINSAPE